MKLERKALLCTALLAILSALLVAGCGRRERPATVRGDAAEDAQVKGLSNEARGGGRKELATVSGDGVKVSVASDAAKDVKVRGLSAEALARLPKVNADAAAVAAAEFEPAGRRFDQGALVTWTLSGPTTPGTELWIVTYDNDLGEWLNTGEKAAVQLDGRTATGVVRHFSTIGLSPIAAKHTEKDDPEQVRVRAYKRIIVPKFPAKSGSGGHAPEAIDQKKFEAAKEVYTKWAQGNPGARVTEAVMCDIYRAGDYKTVKALIQAKVISEAHSIAMADLRTAMVVDTLLKIGAEKKWAIYRSDTGNQASGMASDMDHTLLVYEVRPDGREVRVEKADAELCKLFKQRFDARNRGITTEHFDICSIAGSDNPPEWRLTKTQVDASNLRPVKLHIAETMLNLRTTPGAYTYVGAIVSQVQKRVAKAMEDKLRAQADIESGKPGRPDPRTQPLAEEVRKLGITSTEQIAMHKLGPDASGNWRAQEVGKETAMEVMFKGAKPELLRGHAYDSAVANYLEHMHHLHDRIPEAKYPLRAVNDVGFLLAAMEGVMPAGMEYESLSSAERLEFLRKTLGSNLPDAFLKRWNQCLDMSAEMRAAHKKQQLNEAKVDGLLEPLAQEFGQTIAGAATEEAKTQARETALAAFRSRTQEFLTYNIVKNCKDRVLDWLIIDPAHGARSDVQKAVNAEDVKKAIDPEGRMDPQAWEKIKTGLFQNYGEIARLQLLFSFRELPQAVVDRCMNELQNGRNPPLFDANGKLVDKGGRRFSPEDIAKVKGLLADARDPKWAEKAFPEYPELYKSLYEWEAKMLAQAKAAARADLVQRWSERFKVFVLSQVGLGAPEQPAKIVEFCKARGWKTMARPVNNRAACITGRVAMHYITDPGSWQAGVEVMRAYAESDGDPKVWKKAAMQQAIYMIPVFGQGKAAWDGDWWARGTMVLALVLPGAAEMQMTLAIGESALVIYENEFVRPITNGLADAAYKGWVGPSLKEFGVDAKEVKQFTEEDEKALADLQEQIGQLQAREGPYANISNPVARLSEMLKREQEMLAKRSIWDAYNAEINRLEHNNQTIHKRVTLPAAPDFTECAMNTPGPLLARVKPIVFYSRSNAGDVDLTVKFTQGDRDRLDKLPDLLKAELAPVKRVAIQEEKDVLSDRLREYERAQHYLEAMKTNYELALQIRRDSLYPYRLNDPEAKEDMKNPREFVESWLRIRRNILPKALADVGVGDGTWNPHVFKDAGEALLDRFLADFERSKKLWLARGKYKAGLRQAEEARFHRRQHHEMMNALGEAAVSPPVRLSSAEQGALSSAGIDPAQAVKLHAVAEALRLRHMPEAAPRVKVGLVTSTDADNKTVITPDVKVTANPEIYVPPYQVAWYQLGPDDVRAAYTSRTYRGLPLGDDDVKVLKAYVDALDTDKTARTSDKDPVNPLFLTFVFCQEVKIPNRVVPETVSDLPGLTKYTIPMPKGMVGPEGGEDASGPLASGYLFGSYACMLRPTSPFSVESRRQKTNNIYTQFIVTSPNIEALDKEKQYTRLHYTVYVSDSPDGPLEPCQEFYLDQGTKIVEDPKHGAYVRIAKDKILLEDNSVQEAKKKHDYADKPLYYRVGEKWVRDFKEQKEVLSDVVLPGDPAIILGWGDNGNWTQSEIRCPGYNLSFITVGVGPQNMSFLCPGCRVMVDDGVRKTHHWSPRCEGKQRFGQANWKSNWLQVEPPTPPAGMTLTITGEYEGKAAIPATVKVIPNITEKDRQRMQKEVDDLNKRHAGATESLQMDIKRETERAAQWRKRLADKPSDIKTFGEAYPYMEMELEILDAETRLKVLSECALPFQQLARQIEHCYFTVNYKGAPPVVRQMLALKKRETELWIAGANAKSAVRKKAFGLRGAPADVKDPLDDDIRRAQACSRNVLLGEDVYQTYHAYGFDFLVGRMFVDVFYAGDADLLREMYDRKLDAMKAAAAEIKDPAEKKRRGTNRLIGDTMMKYAEQWILLSGAREKAAAIYKEGYRLSGITRPFEQIEQLPEWWPEGKDGTVFRPEDHPKDKGQKKRQ